MLGSLNKDSLLELPAGCTKLIKANRTALEKLDRVQNSALRLVLAAPRSTLIAILELATGGVSKPSWPRKNIFAQAKAPHSGRWRRNSPRNAAE
ncbi:hypothetical protein PoB_003240100 [Plakobranchus ocellatus]|uniref:Uncharacterized protein n=1 Tax=Plakobranchus ocellatus TaxID=259542 RepID=A0AAV4AGZ6_9GAST|nr:hypothetical protein PoB_003240100 [Plakobranchus ocellatus]